MVPTLFTHKFWPRVKQAWSESEVNKLPLSWAENYTQKAFDAVHFLQKPYHMLISDVASFSKTVVEEFNF